MKVPSRDSTGVAGKTHDGKWNIAVCRVVQAQLSKDVISPAHQSGAVQHGTAMLTGSQNLIDAAGQSKDGRRGEALLITRITQLSKSI